MPFFSGDGSSPCLAPPRASPVSRRLRALIRRLDRATVRVGVIDDDRGAHDELVPDLPDFRRERDIVDTVVVPSRVMNASMTPRKASGLSLRWGMIMGG